MKVKRLIVPAMTIALVAGAAAYCGNGDGNSCTPQEEQAANEDDQPAEEVDEPFGTKKHSIERRYKQMTCTITADYPQRGNAKLQESVKKFIDKSLGGKYSGDKNNADAVLEFYALQTLENLKDGFEEDMKVSVEYSIRLERENDNCVTFMCTTYEETEGPHPNTTTQSASFRKKDGKQFTWDMMNTKSNEFKELLKEGLKAYFNEGDPCMSDEDLADQLIGVDNVNKLPLPVNPPIIGKKNLLIYYNPYEISPHAAGCPEVKLPLGTARKLIKEEYADFLK